MLIFKRRSGESFSVGDSQVTVYIHNGQIRVAVDAPKEIPVLRDDAISTDSNHNEPENSSSCPPLISA
ncbi:carbon storage regulator [Aestuariicella sp. G3-2]|uniref:carbon storage regulator n=1 Tax=Pseudomaricurvus albidus TaxID=2842452 RepID=UPI001C0C45CA|nr:carbon storage regulator [Aestuariicella albida]MBU3068282.1 carbon storage regulator [Aestuariicella albida]